MEACRSYARLVHMIQIHASIILRAPTYLPRANLDGTSLGAQDMNSALGFTVLQIPDGTSLLSSLSLSLLSPDSRHSFLSPVATAFLVNCESWAFEGATRLRIGKTKQSG